MEIFIRAEVAETCYLDEAAHWIAFGVVPTFWPDENGHDERQNVDAHLDHLEGLASPTYFPIAPIAHRFLEHDDAADFARHMTESYGQTVKEARDAVELQVELHKKYYPAAGDPDYDQDRQNEFERELSALESELESAMAIAPFLAELDQLVEIARSKLFTALVQGKLAARGIELLPSPDDGPMSGRFGDIPRSDWRMSDVAWPLSNLGTGEDEQPRWIAAQVSFSELMMLVPQPDIGKSLRTLEDFGACLIARNAESEGEAVISARATSRGAPKQGAAFSRLRW
ncbi:hypothetical protein QWZ10_02985 [Paracoccus cavernae]|uniref:Uncharacterized protein n=1 Tax=Paracoccus cavernae TaxID=1571207 RepID=A0ABT8D705_9RHOB|nr:hypothetical protein [Paracoccus cavernae]